MLKILGALLVATLATVPSPGLLADDHHHHVRHNMVVYGEKEVHASHIVYKAPHNVQVIVRIEFPEAALEAYRAARADYPTDTYLFLLDPIDIAKIDEAESLTGALFRRDAGGRRVDLAASVTVDRADFDVVYLQELPLSLAPD